MNDCRILLIDDEKDIVDLIGEALIKDGFFNIQKGYSGQDALMLCREFQPEVLVLDVMLPDMDGLEVCRKIREFSICSILFLSSRNDDIDKILGLSCGGDDYITKPFSPRELVFRIKAQLRRQEYDKASPKTGSTDGLERNMAGIYVKDHVLTAGLLTLNTDSGRAFKAGKELALTGREFLLLSYLMENADRIISKERLYEQVWGEYSSICDNTIMVHIRHLREKLEDNPSHPRQLITVKGLGYKLRKRMD